MLPQSQPFPTIVKRKKNDEEVIVTATPKRVAHSKLADAQERIEEYKLEIDKLKHENEQLRTRIDTMQQSHQKWMAEHMEKMESRLQESHSQHIQSLKQSQQQMTQMAQGTLITLHNSIAKSSKMLPYVHALPKAPRRQALEFVSAERDQALSRGRQVSNTEFTARLEQVRQQAQQQYVMQMIPIISKELNHDLQQHKTPEDKKRFVQRYEQELNQLDIAIRDQQTQLKQAKDANAQLEASSSEMSLETLQDTKSNMQKQIAVAEDQLAALETKRDVLDRGLTGLKKEIGLLLPPPPVPQPISAAAAPLVPIAP